MNPFSFFRREAAVQQTSNVLELATSPVLFLDFDGVLHIRQRGTLERLALVEEFLRRHPSVQVVPDTTWRMQESLEELAQYFSPLLRCRIEGVTPFGNRTPYSRYLEIMEYLGGSRRLWCALDDEPQLFPPNCPQLVVTDPNVALLPEHLAQVEKILQLVPGNFQ